VADARRSGEKPPSLCRWSAPRGDKQGTIAVRALTLRPLGGGALRNVEIFKVVGCRRHSSLYGVRLRGGRSPMITDVAALQILWKELDPNDGWTRITGKEGK
jgi:hypothetical protein